MSPSDDRCAHHPHVAAVVTCMSCGLRVCRDCVDVESGADSCRPCVAARPPEEQRPPSQLAPAVEQLPTSPSETSVEQGPKSRSDTGVVLGYIGLIVGGLVPLMPIPFGIISPLVMLGLGTSAMVMASRDFADIGEGKLPLTCEKRVRRGQALGLVNVVAGVLCGTCAGLLFWSFTPPVY